MQTLKQLQMRQFNRTAAAQLLAFITFNETQRKRTATKLNENEIEMETDETNSGDSDDH